MILIFGREIDGHIQRITELLSQRKVEWSLIDVDTPWRSAIEWRQSGGILSGWCSESSTRIRLSEIRSILVRFIDPYLSRPSDPVARDFATHEWRNLLYDFAGVLRDRFWINHPYNTFIAEHKLFQLQRAAELGFKVPETLVTNQVAALDRFSRVYEGDLVLKPFTHQFPGSGQVIFTTRLSQGAVERAAKHLPLVPTLFQEYIQKAYELRVFVLGDEVWAVAIDAQDDPDAAVDWRIYPVNEVNGQRSIDYSRWKCQSTHLPDSVQKQCTELIKSLGLFYGAIDLICTPDNEYVFLEVNSAGAYGWLEDACALSISHRLADALELGALSNC